MVNAECSGRIADVNYFRLVEFNSSLTFFFLLSLVEIENEIFTDSIQNLWFLKQEVLTINFFPITLLVPISWSLTSIECIRLSVWCILVFLFDSYCWHMRTLWRPFKGWCPWVRLRGRWLAMCGNWFIFLLETMEIISTLVL